MTEGAGASTNGRPFRVIVADDSEVNLLVLTKMLARLGCATDRAVNGVEAVELSERKAPDMILLDLNMPEMDGIEAATAIRARHPRGTLPIVAVTAHPESRHQTAYARAEFDGLIAKPVNMATLERIVGSHRRKRA